MSPEDGLRRLSPKDGVAVIPIVGSLNIGHLGRRTGCGSAVAIAGPFCSTAMR